MFSLRRLINAWRVLVDISLKYYDISYWKPLVKTLISFKTAKILSFSEFWHMANLLKRLLMTSMTIFLLN
jgi:hypothetical protein